MLRSIGVLRAHQARTMPCQSEAIARRSRAVFLNCCDQLTGEEVGFGAAFGAVLPHGLTLGVSLAAGLGDAAGEADGDGAGGDLPSMLHGLGFDDGAALAAGSGVVALGPQPPSDAAMVAAISKKIGFFIFGFLQSGACMTSRKAFTNIPGECRSRVSL